MKLFIFVSQTVQAIMKCLLFVAFHLGLHCLPKYLFTSTVNVLKLRTLKNNYFFAVRNFRNYVSEKVLVFVILECGL